MVEKDLTTERSSNDSLTETTDNAPLSSGLSTEGVRFIDFQVAHGKVSEAFGAINKVQKEAEGRSKVLAEAARRARNRADLIRRVAVDEFVPDMRHAMNVYELFANHKFDLLEFDMTTLFPGKSREEMERYIGEFRAARLSSRFSFPMALGVWGDPRELEEYRCSDYTNIDLLRDREKHLPSKQKFFLTRWGSDLRNSFNPSSETLFSLPVLEDPRSYDLESFSELEAREAQFAKRVIDLYDKKQKALGAKFQPPVIRRLLIVMPGSRLPDQYSLEFVPKILFSTEEKSSKNVRAYDPYALVGGVENPCGNYLKVTYFSSDSELNLSNGGKQAIFSIESFQNMNLRNRMNNTLDATYKDEFMGNRVGLVLFPGHIIPQPEEQKLQSSGSIHYLPEADKRLNIGSEGGVNMISEASVKIGTSGIYTARKDAGYKQGFIPDDSISPEIYMIRYVTVVRPS